MFIGDVDRYICGVDKRFKRQSGEVIAVKADIE
jgi:hypothetical protein